VVFGCEGFDLGGHWVVQSTNPKVLDLESSMDAMALTMIRIESAELWERFIAKHSPGALFQSWVWGEVEKKRGGVVWRFGAYHGKRLIGIFQVRKVTAKRGTFLHVRHGPILVAQDRASWFPIVAFLKDLGRRQGAWFIRVSPQIEDSESHRQLLAVLGMRPAPIHAMDGEHCWVLDLAPREEELLAHMRKTTRYEIRRAQKLGVVVEKTVRPDKLGDFFSLYKKTAQRHNFVPHQGIAEEFTEFVKQQGALLLLGRYKGNVLGAAILLFYGQQAIYHHSASIPTRIPVNYLIQWEAIREARRRSMVVYNFWGIAPEDNPHHPWRGLTLFKKGFGGREIRFIHAHDLPLSPWYAIPRTLETLKRVLKGY